jgi:hypothetical protein
MCGVLGAEYSVSLTGGATPFPMTAHLTKSCGTHCADVVKWMEGVEYIDVIEVLW